MAVCTMQRKPHDALIAMLRVVLRATAARDRMRFCWTLVWARKVSFAVTLKEWPAARSGLTATVGKIAMPKGNRETSVITTKCRVGTEVHRPPGRW